MKPKGGVHSEHGRGALLSLSLSRKRIAHGIKKPMVFGLGVLISAIAVFYAAYIAKAESAISVTGQATVLNTGANVNFTTNNANVKISDTTGNFSGYAWSENAGWIAFGTVDNPDGPVTLNFSTGAITGKAKILDLGSLVDFNAAPYGSNVVIDATGNFSGYAWSVSLGWLSFTGVLTTGSSLKPAAPSGFYGTASSTLQIIWNWVDNALTENKYEVQDAAHADLVDLAANIISWIEPGLLANTPYNRHSAVFNHFGSLDSNADTKYTLIEPITGITWGAIANNSIQFSPTNTPSNLALGTSGIQYCNTTTATCSAWQQNVNPWTSNGLNPNTQYTFTIQSRNGDGITTTAFNGPGNTKYTLASDPSPLTATALSSSSIKLDWTSGGAQSKFNLYRDGISGVGLLIYSANDLTYTDTGLAASSTHTYYVYAVNGDDLETTNFSTATTTTQAVPGGGGSKPKVSPSPSPSVNPTPSPSPTPSSTPEYSNHYYQETFTYPRNPSPSPSVSIPPKTEVGQPTQFNAPSWWQVHFGWLHFPRISWLKIPVIRLSFQRVIWELGDGAKYIGSSFKHAYTKAGQYIVKVTTIRNGQKEETTQTIVVAPPPPEITNINAQGNGLLIKGKAYPKSLVYLTIHSDPFTIKTQADKKGFFSYLFKEPEKDIPAGEHQISAKAVVYTSDKKEIAGAFSKSYDFVINYSGQLTVTTKQLLLWQIIGLIFGLMTLILITKYIIIPKIKSKKGVL